MLWVFSRRKRVHAARSDMFMVTRWNCDDYLFTVIEATYSSSQVKFEKSTQAHDWESSKCMKMLEQAAKGFKL